LIRNDINIFWKLLFITVIAEFLERFLKNKIYWRRPLFEKKDRLPHGLVGKWYETGSFPSGHTVKAVYFLLFLIQFQVFPLPLFLIIVVPLLFFRVVIGFHYPIDMLGGILTGVLVWLPSKMITAPDYLNKVIKTIFNFIFRI
jgi:membrane-associated phospholipid phosphatase